MAGNDPLDLSRDRSVAEVMGTTVETFGSYLSLFLSTALLIVAPVTLLVVGVWQRELLSGSHLNEISTATETVSTLIYSLAVVPLVTGLHTVIITQLGRGIRPSFGGVLREAGPRLPVAVATVLLYSLGIVCGYLLFIVPGIWLMVRWYLAVQCTMVNSTGPAASLGASADLVLGRWWRTFGAILVAAIGFGLPGVLLEALARDIHNGVAYVTLEAVIQAVVVSLTSVYGTLLFFSWRASRNS